jgi:hypothetical protein
MPMALGALSFAGNMLEITASGFAEITLGL